MTYEYSGYLLFAPLSEHKIQEVKELMGLKGLDLFLEPNALEFEYTGRDTNRKVARLLCLLAEIIHDAEGEIVCTIEKECADPDFEFYSIRGGMLYRQKGRIVREDTKEIFDLPSVNKNRETVVTQGFVSAEFAKNGAELAENVGA